MSQLSRPTSPSSIGSDAAADTSKDVPEQTHDTRYTRPAAAAHIFSAKEIEGEKIFFYCIKFILLYTFRFSILYIMGVCVYIMYINRKNKFEKEEKCVGNILITWKIYLTKHRVGCLWEFFF